MRLNKVLVGLVFSLWSAISVRADVVEVAAGADIQEAINRADAGDVVQLLGKEYQDYFRP